MSVKGSLFSQSITERAQESLCEWMKAFNCSTHLLMNQWGVNTDEIWMHVKTDEKEVSDTGSVAEQFVQQHLNKMQKETSIWHFKHDEESWKFVQASIDVTIMV
eukprot:TRINITY_DN1281_c0_g1_i2.p7 TRINITY_DN1281_c0_g1~~TRINITY_DN1281_c0_g1_i2.p7  ORF type:complete len:104 (-),score=13.93 TRINITY_DN1281_c0_g1_i2:1505-1816(-)